MNNIKILSLGVRERQNVMVNADSAADSKHIVGYKSDELLEAD